MTESQKQIYPLVPENLQFRSLQFVSSQFLLGELSTSTATDRHYAGMAFKTTQVFEVTSTYVADFIRQLLVHLEEADTTQTIPKLSSDLRRALLQLLTNPEFREEEALKFLNALQLLQIPLDFSGEVEWCNASGSVELRLQTVADPWVVALLATGRLQLFDAFCREHAITTLTEALERNPRLAKIICWNLPTLGFLVRHQYLPASFGNLEAFDDAELFNGFLKFVRKAYMPQSPESQQQLAMQHQITEYAMNLHYLPEKLRKQLAAAICTFLRSSTFRYQSESLLFVKQSLRNSAFVALLFGLSVAEPASVAWNDLSLSISYDSEREFLKALTKRLSSAPLLSNEILEALANLALPEEQLVLLALNPVFQKACEAGLPLSRTAALACLQAAPTTGTLRL